MCAVAGFMPAPAGAPAIAIRTRWRPTCACTNNLIGGRSVAISSWGDPAVRRTPLPNVKLLCVDFPATSVQCDRFARSLPDNAAVTESPMSA